MPTTPNPNLPEFYVYRFFANGRTFYVGEGHWIAGQSTQRVSDRGKYVRRLMNNPSTDWTKRELVLRVLRRLRFKHGVQIRWEFLVRDLTQPAALEREKEVIKQCLQDGCVLANGNHLNPSRPTEDQVVRYVLGGSSTASNVGSELDFGG